MRKRVGCGKVVPGFGIWWGEGSGAFLSPGTGGGEGVVVEGFGCGSEDAIGGTMPRFMPVQCHKCSVLQIKPAQKLRLGWCCSMCRKPDVKVSVAAAESHVSDVSLFVEELDLPQEAEEMGAVANTFRGVENLDGVFNWEGLYFQSAKSPQQKNWKRVKPIEIYEDGFARRVEAGEKDLIMRSSDVGQRRFGSEQSHFLSSLWGRWHQKASKKDVVELMEFAGGPGNEENVPPRS